MSSSLTQAQGSSSAPGSGITGGYTGNSLAIKAVIAVFAALSIYNAIELIALVFLTFTRYKGVYFWSLFIASWGIIPYTLGFLLKFFEITTSWDKYISVSLLTIGWYAMVTGQSVVLWSRLHLLVTGLGGVRTLRWTKYMIFIDAVILHVPTTVLTFGSNGDIGTATFVRGFNVYEKVQMVGFCLQELILSSIYILNAIRILRTSLQPNTRKLLYQLFTINVLIILMDVALLGVEFANYYVVEATFKGVVYSVKLKLEFAVLGKLVNFVTGNNSNGQSRPSAAGAAGRKQSVGFVDRDRDGCGCKDLDLDLEVQEFVDPSRSPSDVTHATSHRPESGRKKSSSRGDEVSLSDLSSLANFEHVEGRDMTASSQKMDPEERKFEHYEHVEARGG